MCVQQKVLLAMIQYAYRATNFGNINSKLKQFNNKNNNKGQL